MSITFLPEGKPVEIDLVTVVHPEHGTLVMKTADAGNLISDWNRQATNFGWSKDSSYYYEKIWKEHEAKALSPEQVTAIADAMATLAASGVRFV